MAQHNIFREELATAYPTYGLALWEPGPGGQYDTVEVGDVGFIRRGHFQRLFNVLHPRDHPSHRIPSLVPEDHEQLQLLPGHIVKGEIRAGSGQNTNHFPSRTVTQVSHGLGTLASRPDDDSRVAFLCEGKQGALLSLPVSAQSEDTVALATFGKWMVTHIDSWFAFTRNLGLGVDRMEDIILVTGRHLTKTWINVAFNQRRRDAGVSFNAYLSRDSDVHLERHYAHGGELKLGPTGKDLPEDQCIFLRGFRVARILGIWPRLQGQAGPAPGTSGPEPEPERGAFELLSGPGDTDHHDPLHVLIRYIAEQAPQCDIVLVHDDDLTDIGNDHLKASQPDELMQHLRGSSPAIQQFQCDSLHVNKSGPGTDAAAIVTVATLSKHLFEEPREGPPLPRSPWSVPESSSLSTSLYTPFATDYGGSDTLDYRVLLNDLLQGHPTGNLAPYFHYVMTKDDEDDYAPHIAEAKFRGVTCAVGKGRSKSQAKHAAARQVYSDFVVDGVPESSERL